MRQKKKKENNLQRKEVLEVVVDLKGLKELEEEDHPLILNIFSP